MKILNFKVWMTVLHICSSIPSLAYDYYIDGIYYNLNEDGESVSVTYRSSISYNSYSGELVIPSTVSYQGASFNVTSIGSEAFRDCSSLTYIEIPKSVTSIGDAAFYKCSFTSIEIPNSVTCIEEYAFYSCSSLTSIEIPNSVINIGKYAFYGCI